MEITCARCHQVVEVGTSYCSNCGMPQIVYSTEGVGEQSLTERGEVPVRDAASVDWKQAIRVALILAIPAGILSSMLSPVSIFGMLLMGGTGAWVVAIYLRKERPLWITIGAGARIGLVTGILGAWTAVAATGASLFAMRFFFRQGKTFDSLWQSVVDQQLSQRAATGFDAHALEILRSWMLSPAGRAGWVVGTVTLLAAVLVMFAVAGGALGARLLGRPGRPQM
jgi:RNA polymerase subunit RPABC4/transcription elongation factor Spt4